MSNSKSKTTEEYISEIKELKQNLSEADKALKKQVLKSRQLEEKIEQLTDNETQRQYLIDQLNEGLKTSEKNYMQLFDSMEEMFQIIELVYDSKGKAIDYYYLQVNPAFEKLVNKKKEELVGKRAKEIFGIVEDHWLASYEKVDKTGEALSFENYGEELDKYYYINAWKIGKNIVGVTSSDITERKNDQISLIKSDDLLNEAQKSARIGSWDWDIETGDIFWSQEMFSLMEMNPNIDIPSYAKALEKVHPEDRAFYENSIKDALDNSSVYNVENRIVLNNGSVKHMHSKGEVVLNEKRIPVRMFGTVQDITEKKTAEELLKENEAQLKFAQQSAGAGLWDWNMKTNELKWSPELFALFGLDPEQNTASFDSWEKCMHPDDKGSANDKLNISIKDHIQLNNEYRVVHPNGNVIWINAIGNTSYDVNGNPIHNAGICIDITKRKIVEQEIVKTKQFYENILEGVQDGIWVTDKNDVIFYANSAMEKIAGVPREQIQGNHVLNNFPEETTGELIRFYKQAKKEKRPVWYDIRVKTPTNKNTWQNGWLIPQYDNKDYEGIICTIRDITERKQAEVNVRKLSTAVQQGPAIIAITDTQGKLEYVNPKFTEITGYSSSEAIGQASNVLKSGEQDSAFYKEMWETVEAGKVWRGQFHNKKKNGELFWEAASISAILNDSGDIINYIKIGEDITKQKNTEAELKIALEKALESDRLKSAFLANMSHEIRTPMNGILGFVNLLTETDLNRAQIKKYKGIINKSSDRLLNTISDIIDISKIEAGEMPVCNTETSINNVMEELYSLYMPEAKRKGLSLFLKPSLSDEQATITTDRHILHEILTNLIKNAIKYTEKGDITLGYHLKEDLIEFFVEDTGIGIPMDRTQAIFNRFEQADIEDRKAFEGSGLGLAISKAYAEMLGGGISVESCENKGSKFTITIPYIKTVKKEIEQLPLNISNDTTRIENMNVLIVEDEDVSAELLQTILEGHFRKIFLAKNGIDAIQLCKDKPEIDLVLMDIRLPKLNGYDATREIRKFNNELLIIAQTAYAKYGDKEKAIEAGCNDYVAKPINKALLLETIDKLLN